MAKPLLAKSQNDMLLKHFNVNPTISAVEAQAIFRIRSLSKRICELRDRGHKFAKEMRRDSTGQRYVRYTYKGKAA